MGVLVGNCRSLGDDRGLAVLRLPPNILISRHGEVKLVDFGLAKAASQLEHTQPGVVKGKLSYLSPEAAAGRELDQRADLFACGALLFEMLRPRSRTSRSGGATAGYPSMHCGAKSCSSIRDEIYGLSS